LLQSVSVDSTGMAGTTRPFTRGLRTRAHVARWFRLKTTITTIPSYPAPPFSSAVNTRKLVHEVA